MSIEKKVSRNERFLPILKLEPPYTPLQGVHESNEEYDKRLERYLEALTQNGG